MNLVELFRAFHKPPILFFPIHRQLLGRATTAILFSYLVRQWGFHDRPTIYNTDAEIMGMTGLSRHELNRAKEDLKQTDFVKVFRAGNDGKTHYKINDKVLELKLAKISGSPKSGKPKSGKPNPSVLRKAENPIREHTKKRTLNYIPPPEAGDGYRDEKHGAGKMSQKWLNMAGQLSAAIAQAHKINKTSKPLKWARDFRLLHTEKGFPIADIRAVLDWYCEKNKFRYGTDYWFVVESGKAFREKFSTMKSSMTKELIKSGEIDPPDEVEPENEITSVCVGVEEGTPENLAKWEREREENDRIG